MASAQARGLIGSSLIPVDIERAQLAVEEPSPRRAPRGAAHQCGGNAGSKPCMPAPHRTARARPTSRTFITATGLRLCNWVRNHGKTGGSTRRPGSATAPDGVSRTAVHRLSTGTLRANATNPPMTKKSRTASAAYRSDGPSRNCSTQTVASWAGESPGRPSRGYQLAKSSCQAEVLRQLFTLTIRSVRHLDPTCARLHSWQSRCANSPNPWVFHEQFRRDELLALTIHPSVPLTDGRRSFARDHFGMDAPRSGAP